MSDSPLQMLASFIVWPFVSLMQMLLNTFAFKLFFNFLSKASFWGWICIHLPEESEPKIFGEKESKRGVTIKVKNTKEFIWRCVTQADVGLAESYIAGDYECEDITMLLKIFIANRYNMNGLDTSSAWISHILDRLSHLRRANTIEGARKNIEKHYDLGNDMFELFLDPSMTYSCGIFNSEKESLEEAQMNKIREIIRKADIQKSDHVLEIGSGWGALSIEAVKLTGCRVTTLTLSSQQKEYVDDLIQKLGLDDRIEVKLMDYRDLNGKFDKIVSVEMLEAVGHEFLPIYFESAWNLLNPGGKMVFQVITTPNKSYEDYRRGCDFIQKHIFPGSICPSVNAMLSAIEEKTNFVVEEMQNIGYHYSRTLREWRNNFMMNRHKLLSLGYDMDFLRKWEYYFCYCEAGFEMQYLGNYQIVLSYPKYMNS